METGITKLLVSVSENLGTYQKDVLGSGHSGQWFEFFLVLVLSVGAHLTSCSRASPLGPGCESGSAVGEGHRAHCVLCALNGPQCHAFGPLLSDPQHLLEMVLNHSSLDLSKIGTLKWRLEKRRLDFFPPEILNARKIELFELMNCLKQWGVSPFVLALQN